LYSIGLIYFVTSTLFDKYEYTTSGTMINFDT
jgi:hypothetical protein